MAERSNKPLSISFHGLGGQGGGVLADWLVELAEHNGYLAQATSVPGVAQRTGATVYYIEIFPRAQAEAVRVDPVLALMPMPGDVDLVVASELIEAGRAVARGVVTPDRTTLIAASHREYSISEKSALGDGTADSEAVMAACKAAANRFICFDMQAMAERHGSVISAALLGAIAASGALPFPRTAYEDAIKHSGVGVDTSLATFAATFDIATNPGATGSVPAAALEGAPAANLWRGQSANGEIPAQIVRHFPQPAQDMVLQGARRCADYQDGDYARSYLKRLLPILALDTGHDGFLLTRETARYLALWMSFEDPIRVADLKIRAERLEKCRVEVRADPGQIVYLAEFMHPRLQEVCDTLPAPVGRFVLRSRFWRRALSTLFNTGRRIHSTALSGFLLLFLLSRLRRWRRSTLRFQLENAAIESWLADLAEIPSGQYSLALELARCPRLIKGYGDARERGMRNFNRITSSLRPIRSNSDAADILARLREAALADESGQSLDRELTQTVGPAPGP